MTGSKASGFASYLSLFTSLSTLACCALPSLLVLLGLGATVASVLTAIYLTGFSVSYLLGPILMRLES